MGTHTWVHVALETRKIGSPGVTVTDGCGLPNNDIWNSTQILWKNSECSFTLSHISIICKTSWPQSRTGFPTVIHPSTCGVISWPPLGMTQQSWGCGIPKWYFLYFPAKSVMLRLYYSITCLQSLALPLVLRAERITKVAPYPVSVQ